MAFSQEESARKSSRERAWRLVLSVRVDAWYAEWMPKIDDLHRRFFTPARRARYRSLPEMYPLWCGLWPEGVGQLESTASDPETREGELFRELESYFGGHVLHITDEGGVVVVDSLSDDFKVTDEGVLDFGDSLSDDFEPDETVPCPVPHFLLAIAIWALGVELGETTLLSHWAKRVTAILTEKSRNVRWHARTKRLVPADAPVSGVELMGWRGRFLRERDETLGEELRQAWLRVGIEAGVIPDLTGDLATTLPDSFLARWHAEAERIVADVQEFQPSAGDLQVIDDALTSSSSVSVRWSFQRAMGGQKEPRGSFVTDLLVPTSGTEWLYRLQYPFLARDEIALLCEGSTTPSRRPKLARGLILARLRKSGITLADGTLRQRLKAASKA